MSFARRFLTSSGLNLFDQGLRFAAIFVMTPIILGALGDDLYGFWILLMSIFGHYALLDFGLSFSISRFFARAIGKRDDTELEAYINTALSIFLRVGSIAAVVSAVAWFVAPVFNPTPERLQLVRWIIVIYGTFLSVGFPVRVFRSYLKSEIRYDVIVFASTVQIILGNLLLFYFLKNGHGLLTLAIVNAGAGFLEYAIVTAGALRLMRRMRIRRSLKCPDKRRELIKYSATAFINQLGSNLRNGIDPLIIGTVVAVSSVTFYSIGMRFPIFFTDVMGAVLGGQLLAIFSQMHGRSDDGTLEKGYLAATRLSTVIAVFAGASLIFYGHDFIERWVGPGYLTSYHIMVILTIPYVFMLINYPAISFLYTLNKHSYLAKTTIIGGLCNVVLSIILANHIGIFGVVIATLIEMLVIYCIVFPLVITGVSTVTRRQLVLDSMLKPFALTALLLAPFFLAAKPFLLPDFLRLGLMVAVQILWFGATAWFIILRPAERQQILAGVKLRKPSH